MRERPSAHLGSLDLENFGKVKDWFLKKVFDAEKNWKQAGLSYLEDYQKGRDEEVRAYGYLNALGYIYGYAMAEAYLDDFKKAEIPEEAAEAVERVLPEMESIIVDIMNRASPMDIELARQAVREVGDRLPAGDPPEDMIRVGTELRNGLYLRDLSYSAAGAIQTAMNAAADFLAWHRMPYPVSFNPETYDYVPEIFEGEQSRDLLKKALRETNEEIRKRTYYGLRNVLLPDHPNFTILGWSNGGEAWHILWGMIQPAVRQVMLHGGGPISLDSNYILVPFHPEIMKRILPELDPLPLYEYSLEAKLRGQYPEADDRTVRKVLRAIIDAELPEEDPEERALMAIDLWDTFVKAKQGFFPAQRMIEQFFLSLERPVMPYLKVINDWLGERER